MCEIGLALMSNCIIIMLASKTVPVPNIVKTIFLKNHFQRFIELFKTRFLSKLTVKNKYEQTGGTLVDIKDENENESLTEGNNGAEKNTWVLLKERLGKAKISIRNKNKTENAEKEPLRPIAERTAPQLGTLRFEYDLHHNLGIDDLKYINHINSFFAANNIEQMIRQDWEQVVRKIDKIFFVLFMALITFSVIIIFSAAPNIHF